MKIINALGLFVIAALLGLSGFLFGAKQVPAIQPPFGALSTTEFPVNWIGIGGAHTYANSYSLKTGTTTVCSIQAPAATSTLQAAQINFTFASTSAIVVKVGQSSVNSTIATQIGTSYNIAANAVAFIQASTSPAAGASTVLAPNSWINFQVTNGGALDAETGTCQAEFLSS